MLKEESHETGTSTLWSAHVISLVRKLEMKLDVGERYTQTEDGSTIFASFGCHNNKVSYQASRPFELVGELLSLMSSLHKAHPMPSPKPENTSIDISKLTPLFLHITFIQKQNGITMLCK